MRVTRPAAGGPVTPKAFASKGAVCLVGVVELWGHVRLHDPVGRWYWDRCEPPSEVNEAGGTVYTSTGTITQNDVAPLVNGGMYGGDVNVLSGVHGLPNGSTLVEPSFYESDLERFGNLPGVTVHNLPDLAPEQIAELLRGPGTTIGAFCDSGACLAQYR